MKNIFLKLIVSLALLGSIAINAFASINSTGDIYTLIGKLSQIIECDTNQFVNKSDLIGQRLYNFEMVSGQYKNEIRSTQERLKNINSQIEIIESNFNIPESEKMPQIQNLYNEAETIKYDIDSKTLNYLYAVKGGMPSITYQQYAEKFRKFYDSLGM